MKIQTFSVVIGTKACDADCPFCISHITGFNNLDTIPKINWNNFEKAVALARYGNCTTLLFTGKGEPTLYPNELSKYLIKLWNIKVKTGIHPFPFLELQTNALQIGYLARRKMPTYQKLTEEHLIDWNNYGLNTICISVVGINPKHNEEIYNNDYPNLEQTIEYLHKLGFTVRLCVMMQKNKVDNTKKVLEITEWCKKHNIAQCTIRPIRKGTITQQKQENDNKLQIVNPYEQYIQENALEPEQEKQIANDINDKYELIMTIMNGNHQAKIYDVNGQNLCISDCLTREPNSDHIRTLIFYSNGTIMYDWAAQGARLL